MNKRQLSKFKSTVEQAIKNHLKSGGRMIAGEFVIERDKTCMCPVEIVTHKIKIRGKRSPSYESRLAKLLGFSINSDEMWSFIFGYDGDNEKEARGDVERTSSRGHRISFSKDLFLLGKSFRKLYKPMSEKQKSDISNDWGNDVQ